MGRGQAQFVSPWDRSPRYAFEFATVKRRHDVEIVGPHGG